MKQLDNSKLDRKNILNNPFAIEYLYIEIGAGNGIKLDDEYYYTVSQTALFYEVEVRTIERYLKEYSDELIDSGYEVLTGDKLKILKNTFGTDINVGTKTTKLGLFSFKAFINLGMLLGESDRARLLRTYILNIVFDVVSEKSGGSTKYINQRDDSYLLSLYLGENYRKEFIDALRLYVDSGNFKYLNYTNKIYKSIFKERANEYKNILNLNNKENIRDTMYAEVLTTISMYETGLANAIKDEYLRLGRKLNTVEVDLVFALFESNPLWKPQIEMVRTKMASRDYGFREVMHPELIEYVSPLNKEDFERFLGKKSEELSKRIEKYQQVFKRLRDK